MEIRAIARNVRMSAQKVREVVRQIQGLDALAAKAVLAVVPRKSARLVAKTLDSAIANAVNNNNLKAETLLVKEAVVGQATPIKRWVTRARGGGSGILKRSCHISVTLVEKKVDAEKQKPESKKTKAN
ncbi:MAG: 50S ribosomal protein L22 [Pedosphaera sp.]|nr:50S ribosomal protein L22 [Pedosphaera sp.]